MPYYGRKPGVGVGGAVLAVAGVGAVALAIGIFVTAVSSIDDDDAVAVCMNPETNMRVYDNLCGDYGDDGDTVFVGGYHYMIFDTRTYKGDIPAVNTRMPVGAPVGYVKSYPAAGKSIVTKAPASGGKTSTIVRGGFGVPGGAKAATSGGTSGGS